MAKTNSKKDTCQPNADCRSPMPVRMRNKLKPTDMFLVEKKFYAQEGYLLTLKDPVVSPRGSRRLFKKLGADNKTYLLYNFDRHGIFQGHGAESVHQMIADFIQSL